MSVQTFLFETPSLTDGLILECYRHLCSFLLTCMSSLPAHSDTLQGRKAGRRRRVRGRAGNRGWQRAARGQAAAGSQKANKTNNKNTKSKSSYGKGKQNTSAASTGHRQPGILGLPQCRSFLSNTAGHYMGWKQHYWCREFVNSFIIDTVMSDKFLGAVVINWWYTVLANCGQRFIVSFQMIILQW